MRKSDAVVVVKNKISGFIQGNDDHTHIMKMSLPRSTAVTQQLHTLFSLFLQLAANPFESLVQPGADTKISTRRIKKS
jgi:hypothetical protein